MVTNKNKNQQDGLQEVESALTKTEQFLENNLNLVMYVIGGLIVVVLGVIGVQKYYIAPKSLEAQEQMFAAQNYFSLDSFELAINGDGVSLGFLDIVEDYSSTNAGNLANYYIGVSYLHIGEYDLAIDYLKKFDTDDMLVAPLAESAIGDAYVELEDYSKAISAYKKALGLSENELTSPTIMIKLGLALEANGEKEKALKIYEQVKADYPKGQDAVTVERSIARLQQ